MSETKLAQPDQCSSAEAKRLKYVRPYCEVHQDGVKPRRIEVA